MKKFSSGWIVSLGLLITPTLFSANIPSIPNLPDFSYAGYNKGETTLAIRTGVTRSLALPAESAGPALQAAIQNNTTLLIPAGTYNISQVIKLGGKNKVVIRGARGGNGELLTTLRFTKSLRQLYEPNGHKTEHHGYWHTQGGLIQIGKGHYGPGGGGGAPSSEIAFEDIRIDFNRTQYESVQAGYNGFWMHEASNCYLKNVKISNFDHAIIMYNSTQNTVSGVEMNSVRGGHFGVAVVKGSRNMVTNSTCLNSIDHDYSVYDTDFNVLKNSSCANGNWDGISHRGGYPSKNLYCNLNLGDSAFGTSNGSSSDKFGAYETYWNVTAPGNPPSIANLIYRRNEPIVDLHAAQLNARGIRTPTEPGPGPGPEPVLDTEKPSIPAGLAAQVLSATSIKIIWNASTDNKGVSGYDVYRGTVKIATVTTTSHTDAGLTANTGYSYKVAARDQAGNVSNLSAAVNATTSNVVLPPPPPPAGAGLYQAESAVVVGGIKTAKYVDFINATGDYIEWTANATVAGNHKLEFLYALGTGNRPLEIKVNGVVKSASLAFPSTGSFAVYGTVSLTVPLTAGANKIRATAIGSSGANMDALKVSKI